MVIIPNSVVRTKEFTRWLNRLRDRKAVAAINVRVARVELGNLGDARAVGSGVSELRVNFGPGYRLYFTRKGEAVIFLLCGGDKSSQTSDIIRAQTLAQEVHDAPRT